MGTWGYKRPRREVDHSPPTSAEVKNTWIFIPPYTFMGANFTLLFTGTKDKKDFAGFVINIK
jgi:hypothetical protein